MKYVTSDDIFGRGLHSVQFNMWCLRARDHLVEGWKPQIPEMWDFSVQSFRMLQLPAWCVLHADFQSFTTFFHSNCPFSSLNRLKNSLLVRKLSFNIIISHGNQSTPTYRWHVMCVE